MDLDTCKNRQLLDSEVPSDFESKEEEAEDDDMPYPAVNLPFGKTPLYEECPAAGESATLHRGYLLEGCRPASADNVLKASLCGEAQNILGACIAHGHYISLPAR